MTNIRFYLAATYNRQTLNECQRFREHLLRPGTTCIFRPSTDGKYTLEHLALVAQQPGQAPVALTSNEYREAVAWLK